MRDHLIDLSSISNKKGQKALQVELFLSLHHLQSPCQSVRHPINFQRISLTPGKSRLRKSSGFH